MKKLVFGLIATVVLGNLSFGQVSLKECNKQLDSFKSQIKSVSKGQIVSSDNQRPEKLGYYLSQLEKGDIVINTVSHVKLDTKTEDGILDVYSLQYSKDLSKYLIIIENTNDLTQSNIIDASLDFSNESIKVISHDEFLVDTGVAGKRGWSKCFGDCFSAGLDTHGLLGQVIVLGGATSAICPPCGFVALTYVSVLFLGCAGGCVH